MFKELRELYKEWFCEEEVKKIKKKARLNGNTNSLKLTPQQQLIYNNLIKYGETHVFHYGNGFPIRSRIFDLRDKGVNIITIPYDPINPNTKLCKYLLIK